MLQKNSKANKVKFGFILFFTLINLSIFSQDIVVHENSLLWEVSGNDLDKPSYIYGTIHLIPEDDYSLNDSLKSILTSCDILALEIDLDIPILTQLKLAKQIILPEGKTLKDYLSDEDFKAFSSYILDSLKIGQNKFKQILMLKPIFSTSLIITELIPKTKTFEVEFSKIAKKNKMEIIGLETINYQMDILNGVSIEKQIDMMLSEGFSGNPLDDYMELVQIYKDQDINKMLELSKDDDFIEDFENELITNRNKNWIPIIEKEMKKNSIFIAVGAMHLPGEFGVLKLLELQGYRVKAIKI